jgi:endonuclease III
LESLAEAQPTTLEEALSLPGITARKAKILPQFLAIIRQHKGLD